MKRLAEYCKPGVIDKVLRLNPMAILVLCDVIAWCEQNGAPCVITDAASTDAEDKKLKRVSSTHREGRAFDVSVRGWTGLQKAACVQDIGNKHAGIAAVSGVTGKPRLAYLHDAGTGEHLHFQLSRKYAMLDRG